jgi:hypothetical protein
VTTMHESPERLMQSVYALLYKTTDRGFLIDNDRRLQDFIFFAMCGGIRIVAENKIE